MRTPGPRDLAAVCGLLLIFAWCALCGALAGMPPPFAGGEQVVRHGSGAIRAAVFCPPDGGTVRLVRSGRVSGSTANSLRALAGAAYFPNQEWRIAPHCGVAVDRMRPDGALLRRLISGIPVRAGPIRG